MSCDSSVPIPLTAAAGFDMERRKTTMKQIQHSNGTTGVLLTLRMCYVSTELNEYHCQSCKTFKLRNAPFAYQQPCFFYIKLYTIHSQPIYLNRHNEVKLLNHESSSFIFMRYSETFLQVFINL